MDQTELDTRLMRQCLQLAQAASVAGEVPVGAIITNPEGEIIAQAANAPIGDCDPTAHAEILALRKAAHSVGNYRLNGLSLYVSLEPCTMCAGAISQARIARLIYAAPDPKGGAVEHGVQFFQRDTCHHRPEIIGGILAEESGEMLRAFFKARRKSSKKA